MRASAALLAPALFAPAVHARAGDGAAEPPVTTVALAPGGEEVVVGSQAGLSVRAWPRLSAVERPRELHARGRRLATGLAHVHDVAFAPDGGSFAVAGGEPGFEGAIEVRAWPGGELLASHELGDDLFYAAAWRPDGSALVGTGHDGDVLLVEPAGEGAPRRFEGHLSPVLGAAFTPDGSLLVTGGADRSLRVWDADSGACLFVLSNHTGTVRGVAARPAGSAGEAPAVVASIGDDRTVRLWQPAIGRLVRFARLPAEPLDLCWTADGARVLVSAQDGRLYAVDAATVTITGSARASGGWAYALDVSRAQLRGAASRGAGVAVGGGDGIVRALPLSLLDGTPLDAPDDP